MLHGWFWAIYGSIYHTYNPTLSDINKCSMNIESKKVGLQLNIWSIHAIFKFKILR